MRPFRNKPLLQGLSAHLAHHLRDDIDILRRQARTPHPAQVGRLGHRESQSLADHRVRLDDREVVVGRCPVARATSTQISRCMGSTNPANKRS